MKKIVLVSVIVILIAVSGCAIIGRECDYRPFDPGALNSFVPGKTTQVVKLFGAPAQVVKLSNGNAYIYTRGTGKGTLVWLVLVTFVNFDRKYDQVVFFFDKNDVLKHFGSSLDSTKAAYGMPF